MSASSAFAVTFTRIARTGDDPVGIVGPFTDLKVLVGAGSVNNQQSPAIDGWRRVLFIGASADGAQGIFIGNPPDDGTPDPVAWVTDTSVDAPGIVQTYASFSRPSLSDSFVGLAYWGRDAAFRRGLFARFSVTPVQITHKSVVSWLDPVPGTTFLFNDFIDHSLASNGALAFTGDWVTGAAQLPTGLFLTSLVFAAPPASPPFVRIIMTGDDPPGPVGPLITIVEPVTNGDLVSFRGCDGNPSTLEPDKCAVFVADALPNNTSVLDLTNVKTVISKGDPLPEPKNSKLEFPLEVNMDDNDVVFTASATGPSGFANGLYIAQVSQKLDKDKPKKKDKSVQKALEAVVTSVDVPPSPLTKYNVISQSAVSDDKVMFWAGDGVGSPEGNHGT
jgi:hypothetical protein